MSNKFTNVFNSRSMAVSDKTTLTRSEADALYINSSGSDTINGSLIITGNQIITGAASFEQVPQLLTNLQITDDKQLTSKNYVDNTISQKIKSSSFPSKFLINQSTSYTSYTIPGPGGMGVQTKYTISTPKPQDDGWPIFLCFKSQTDARLFLNSSATIEVIWSYSHSKALSTIAGYIDNGDGTYTFDNPPNISELTDFFTFSAQSGNLTANGTALCSKSIISTLVLKPNPPTNKVYVNPLYQSTNLVTATTISGTSIVHSTGVPLTAIGTYPSDLLNIATTFAYWKCYPLTINYIDINKIGLIVKFPQLCKNGSGVRAPNNNPTINGWISNMSCSIEIKNSPFGDSSATLSSTTTPTPILNNESGGAYFSLV
jgi:hypothetical protein